MSDFNKETRGVQDALKMVEGVMLPSLNIKTWLAVNVKTVPLPGEEGAAGEARKNIQVMIGEEGDEKERIEKARLAESQRCVWGFALLRLLDRLDRKTQKDSLCNGGAASVYSRRSR
jgi:hypothetical protein